MSLTSRLPSTRGRSLLAKAAAPAAAPESGTPTSSTPHTTTTTTDQQQQQQHKLKKGAIVHGTVESVSGEGAAVRLDGSAADSQPAHLTWSNLSKQRTPKSPDAAVAALLAPGEHIWAVVADASGPAVKLSTAGLELRPGDMLTDRKAVFAALDKWQAEGNGEAFFEWRGRRELDAFLASKPLQQGSGGGATAATASNKRSTLLRHGDARSWGLIVQPQPSRGDLVHAVVTSVKSYGAFVELDRTRDGLIPASQVSKAYVSESDIAEILKPGERVAAVIHKIEPKRGPSETTAGPDSGRAAGMLACPDYVSVADQQFVLSMKSLEASEGLLRSEGVTGYNAQAVRMHEQLQEQSMERHLDDAADSLSTFRDAVAEWDRQVFMLAPRTIVRGVVVSLHPSGAFVRLEFGPTAFLHEDAISHAKFKRMSDVLQVGSTVYGKLYDRPTNSADASTAVSPATYWISVKDLEGKTPGQLLRDPTGFWKAAEGRYKQQLTQPKKDPPVRETIAMHRSDLDIRPLARAAQNLEHIAWHALAGRPNPGVLMGRGGGSGAGAEAGVKVPLPQEWSGRYAEVAGAYREAVRGMVAEAGRVLPDSVALLLRTAEGEAAAGGADAAMQQLAQPITSSLRHTWWSLRTVQKVTVAKLSLLQLRAAATEYAEAARSHGSASASPSASPSASSSPSSSSPSKQPSAAEVEAKERLVLAAARAVYVARLVRKPEGTQLVKEAYGVLQTLKVGVPKAITDSLLLWGSALLEDSVDLGASNVQESGLLEILAAEGVRPPREWCEVAFRRLYKCMVVDAPPREVTKYLRLMHALHYCPSGMAWWDRLLQQLFSNNSRAAPADKLLPRQTQELREVVAAVLALGQGTKAAH